MLTIFIGIVYAILFYIVYTKFLEYRSNEYEDWTSPPLRLWAFALLVIVEFVPDANLIISLIITLLLLTGLIVDENIRFRYPNSKFFKFLNYDLNANNRKNN